MFVAIRVYQQPVSRGGESKIINKHKNLLRLGYNSWAATVIQNLLKLDTVTKCRRQRRQTRATCAPNFLELDTVAKCRWQRRQTRATCTPK
jgi:hypothetical protein